MSNSGRSTSRPVDNQGRVAYADDKGRKGLLPWWEAAAYGETGTGQNRLRKTREGELLRCDRCGNEPYKRVRGNDSIMWCQTCDAEPVAFHLDPIAKRTRQARLDSLTRRLVDEYKNNPAAVEGVLAEIATEYWKQGAPVTVDQLRSAAAALLTKAENVRR